MKNLILSITLLFFSSIVLAETPLTPDPQQTEIALLRKQVDSLTVHLKTVLRLPSVKNHVDSVQNARLQYTVDSLSDELKGHRIEENFYQTALGNQTAIFAFIVTLASVFLGYLSYRSMQSEVHAIRSDMVRDVESVRSETSEFLLKADKQLADQDSRIEKEGKKIAKAAGNLYLLIAETEGTRNRTDQAVLFSLKSAEERLKYEKDTFIISSIENSYVYFKKAKSDAQFKIALKAVVKEIDSLFATLLKSGRPEIINKVAEFKAEVNAFMKES